MDLSNVTFVSLVTVGVVNVVSFFKPQLDSKVKFGLAVVVAFGLSFVPPTLANEFLDKAKFALEVAFGSSGVYKLAQKVGGA